MKFVADLHLHSKYSRAVSQAMILPQIEKWARLKGINVAATGDFTHPFWFDHLKNEFKDAGNGLYKLRNSQVSQLANSNSEKRISNSDLYFLLSCEISSIYSQGGKSRRIHNLFFFPKLSSVEKFNDRLRQKGANLRSDGRPIVGINSRDLAQIALECDEKALIIPAHAWTPWFSLYGSFSGFDSIEECFGDMTRYIYAVETGLSSDPAMNWKVGDLNNRAVLSFSDAHSLEKMGREATVFEADEISYDAIYEAIKGSALALGNLLDGDQKSEIALSQASSQHTNKVSSRQNNSTIKQFNNSRIAFTIEFYPEEGKYHFTGHRNCNWSQNVEDTKKNGTKCPVCHRELTVGVMHRVSDLASQDAGERVEFIDGVRWVKSSLGRPPYVSLVPLFEIIAEALESTPKAKKVVDTYNLLVEKFGSEFGVLLKADVKGMTSIVDQRVAEGIEKVRRGDIVIEPGYDGNFGVVKIWGGEPEEKQKEADETSQLNLFV